jgi:polysaccharide biosynthesis/export protein
MFVHKDTLGDFGRHSGRIFGSVSRFALGAVVFLGIGLVTDQVRAQQMTNMSADQLMQLQQQYQGRGSSQASGQSLTQSETILQPTAPENTNLPTSRLERILSERAGTRLRQVGYDQLGVGRAVNLPQVGAIQDSYILGAGDEIVVSLRGQENSEYRVTVDRDGRVVLPRLNPVSAAGRSFGEFRQDLINAIHRAYVSTEGFISIGRLRQISVLVSGEVGSPGVRTLTGLSTTMDAILVSGGIKKTGSLRNVHILRGGREITVDLYSVLTGQAKGNSMALTDGDRIVVPPLGRTAAVVGWVRRQGIYELPAGRAAVGTQEFLSLAGGLEVRGKYRMSVLRVAADGRNQMIALESGSGSISDGDILFVQPAANQTSSMATLSGGTALAGKYATAGSKLSELLKSPGALGEDPYTLFGVISRRDPVTLLRTLLPFTPVAVLKGAEDMVIQNDDIVRVISTKEARVLFVAVQQYRLRVASDQEAMLNPEATTQTTDNNGPDGGGTASLAQQLAKPQGGAATGMAERQAFASANAQAMEMTGQGNAPQAGQYPPDGSQPVYPGQPNGYANQPYGMPGQTYGTGQAGAYPDQPYGMPGQANGYPNQPYGMPGQPGTYPQQQAVAMNGEVSRVSDLAIQLKVDPLVLVNFLNERAVNVGGAVQGPGLYLVGPDADIQTVLTAAGGAARWADKSNIEVISTTVDPAAGKARTERRVLSLVGGGDAGYIVSPRDEVRVGEVFTAVGIGSVTLQGQVRHPGTFQIVRGEHLSDVLMRAGGLTDTAYPYGTVFLRHSSALREQDALRRQAQEIESQLLMAMSRRDPNAKMSPESFAAMQTYVNQIKTQKTLGRITVTADPALLAANPATDPLLEPNDIVFVPQRPYAVAVLGEVLQPGSIPFDSDMSASEYIDKAGGYSRFADEGMTILVLPDGSAKRLNSSWFGLGGDSVPPGSTIFVARDVSGIDIHQIITETTGIVSQLAVTAASLAVLSKNN